MTTAATIPSPNSESRPGPVTTVLGRGASFVLQLVKGAGASLVDPATCNAYWIGGNPAIWGMRK